MIFSLSKRDRGAWALWAARANLLGGKGVAARKAEVRDIVDIAKLAEDGKVTPA
jgi:hypothetical protein